MYQELTQYNSPNYTPRSQVPYVYGMPRTIDGVVYHWWGDPAQKPQFLNIISWLCRANGNSSAHVVGESGRVAWIIDAVNAAWHAGNARGNATQVGYECNPRLSDGDYETMGRFHYDMEKAYKKTLAITVHKQWNNTQCSPINTSRIRQIADRHHKGSTKPIPVTVAVPAAVKLAKPIKFKAKLNNTQVWDLTTNPNYKGVKSLKKGEEFIAFAKITFNKSTYYVTEYSFGKKLKHGVNSVDLESVTAPVPVQPEWIRNLKDITDVKLQVLPAAGVKVVNLNTLSPVNDTIIPRGTFVDIAKETTVGGKKFYISSYAASSNAANGILASDLGTIVNPPVEEKPEWLKNLKDITDKDMWTRSETPVLNITDGTTSRTVPVNTKVRITHATQIVGKDLLVLDGQKEVIETIYLSDTEIKNPYDDLKKRVSGLEALVASIVEFLQSIFKNFKK